MRDRSSGGCAVCGIIALIQEKPDRDQAENSDDTVAVQCLRVCL